MKKIKINKITINWFVIDENGEPKLQYRNFSDEKKAAEFVEKKLSQRNVINFVEKKKCSFIEEVSGQVPGQLTMNL